MRMIPAATTQTYYSAALMLTWCCTVSFACCLQVIELNVSTAAVDPQKTRDITEGDSFDIDYSYSVKWKPVAIKFSDRMDRYSRYSFLPQHLEVCVNNEGGQRQQQQQPPREGTCQCLKSVRRQGSKQAARPLPVVVVLAPMWHHPHASGVNPLCLGCLTRLLSAFPTPPCCRVSHLPAVCRRFTGSASSTAA